MCVYIYVNEKMHYRIFISMILSMLCIYADMDSF